LLRYLREHDPESFEAHNHLASNISSHLSRTPFDFQIKAKKSDREDEPSWLSRLIKLLWSWNLKRSRPSTSVRDAVEREYKPEMFQKLSAHAAELILEAALRQDWSGLKLLVSSKLLTALQGYLGSDEVLDVLKDRLIVDQRAIVTQAALGDGVPEYVVLSREQLRLFDTARASCPIPEGFTPYWLVLPVKVKMFTAVLLAGDKSQPRRKLRASARYEEMLKHHELLQDIVEDYQEMASHMQDLVFWWARGPMPLNCVDAWHAEPWMLLAVSQHTTWAAQ
jgi:hypothetical protein